jgi:hypothetical protein
MLCLSNTGLPGDAANRLHVLRLLALIEHPGALPPEAVLRIGREIMTSIGPAPVQLRCDPVTADGTEGERA